MSNRPYTVHRSNMPWYLVYPLLVAALLASVISATSTTASSPPKCYCSSTACTCFNENINNSAQQVLNDYCTVNITSLFISLNKLPSLLPTGQSFNNTPCINLQTLKVRFNTISVLHAIIFTGLTRLTTLDMGYNRINSLDAEGLFKPMGKLTDLILESNQIKKLTQKTFEGLPLLEYLNLENNPFVSIHGDTFKTTPKLQKLFLTVSDGAPTYKGKLPTGLLNNLRQLTDLNITRFNLRSLPDDMFTSQTQLKYLSLAKNGLTNVSINGLRPLGNLLSLNLSGNSLTCLQPDNFSPLTSLLQLDLSSNQITYLSVEALVGLPLLQSLNLDGNPIAVIEPLAFCSVTSLFLLRMNGVTGKVLSETLNDYRLSPFARLSSKAKFTGIGRDPLNGRGTPCTANQNAENGTLLSESTTPVPATISSVNKQCPRASKTEMNWYDRENPQGSRGYLLIIVSLCVAFLFVAFAIIMAYRAWSRRKMSASSEDENGEKQEMLQRSTAMANGNGSNGATTTAVINHAAEGGTDNGSSTSGRTGVGAGGGKVRVTSSVGGAIPVEMMRGGAIPISLPLGQECNADTTITTFGVV